MILSRKEREQLEAVLTDLESIAAGLPDHSTTRVAIYRTAAALRSTIAPAVVTRVGRADGQPT